MQKQKDLGLGLVSALLGILVFAGAMGMPKGPRFFPQLIGGLIILLGLGMIITAIPALLRQAVKEKPPVQFQYRRVLIVIGILAAYYVLFCFAGFTIPTFLLITSTALILGYRNWKVLLLSAVPITVGLYLIFTLIFQVRFPGFFF
jgi:putative tricarboxylic transport membrane protein